MQLDAAKPSQRVAALIIDYTLALLFLAVLGGVCIATADHAKSQGLQVTLALGMVLCTLLVTYGRDSFAGRSLGRRMLGIAVVHAETGLPAGALRCALRNVSTLNCSPLELAMMFTAADGRTISDRIAKTRVITVSSSPRIARVTRALGLAAAGLLALVPVWALLFGLPAPAESGDRKILITYRDVILAKPELASVQESESFRRTIYVFGGASYDYRYGKRGEPLYIHSTVERSTTPEQRLAQVTSQEWIEREVGGPVTLWPELANNTSTDEIHVYALELQGKRNGHYLAFRSKQVVETTLILGTSISGRDQVEGMLGMAPFLARRAVNYRLDEE